MDLSEFLDHFHHRHGNRGDNDNRAVVAAILHIGHEIVTAIRENAPLSPEDRAALKQLTQSAMDNTSKMQKAVTDNTPSQ